MKQTQCLVEIDGRLLHLFRRSFPHVRFVVRGDDALAQAVGKTNSCRIATFGELLTIALDDPKGLPPGAWLKADVEAINRKRAKYAREFGPRPKVGLSWRSRRFIYDRDEKSIEPECLASFFLDSAALSELPETRSRTVPDERSGWLGNLTLRARSTDYGE